MNQPLGFPIKDILDQMRKILNTSQFKNAQILTDFFKFVVTETTKGGESIIKEYTIGTLVLKRSSDFNPQKDAIVRIHAGRLRRAIQEYYSSKGKDDVIVISIPKGGYVPLFEQKKDNIPDKLNAGEKASSLGKPVVAVIPFRNISVNEKYIHFSVALGDQLTIELSRFQDLSVICYASSENVLVETNNLMEAGMLLGTNYILTGSLLENGDKVRIHVQLIIVESGQILWTKTFDGVEVYPGFCDLQDSIVKNVLAEVGGYYGIIYREIAVASPTMKIQNADVFTAIYCYYQYQKEYSEIAYFKAVQALEAAITLSPMHAVSWAMLGELYLDGKALALESITDPLEASQQCAMRALQIDPNCQHAYHTLTWIQLFKRDKEECLKMAERCISLNPNAAGLVGGVAFMLICAGYFEQGMRILKESVTFNPYYPWWINGGFCFYFLHCKKYEEALHWARKMNSGETFWEPLLQSVSLAYLNRITEASNCLTQLLNMEPVSPTKIREMLSTILLSKSLVDDMVIGLEMAGFNYHPAAE